MRREAANWAREAEYDLMRARRALEQGDYALCAFMPQQAAEKALKAAIIALRRELPPRTHDLTRLYQELRGVVQLPDDVVENLPTLSQYYITSRYPNAGLEVPSESFTRTQAEAALRITETVVRLVEGSITQEG